jgi:hypothetical protein
MIALIRDEQSGNANTAYNDYADGSSYGYNYGGVSPKVLLIMAMDLAIYYAIMCVADGAIIRAVAEMYVGQVPTVLSTLQNGLTKLGPLFCTAVVIGASVGIPAIALACVLVLVFGSVESLLIFYVFFLCFLIWVVVVTYHIYPAIVVEDAGTFASISRSWALSSGKRCHIFTTLLIFFVVKWICGAIVSAIGTSGDYSALLAAKVLETVINIIFASLGSVYVPLCLHFHTSFLGISHTIAACIPVSIFDTQSPGHCVFERPLREGRFERKRLDDRTLWWFRVGWRGALRGRHHERWQAGRPLQSIGVKTKSRDSPLLVQLHLYKAFVKYAVAAIVSVNHSHPFPLPRRVVPGKMFAQFLPNRPKAQSSNRSRGQSKVQRQP